MEKQTSSEQHEKWDSRKIVFRQLKKYPSGKGGGKGPAGTGDIPVV